MFHYLKFLFFCLLGLMVGCSSFAPKNQFGTRLIKLEDFFKNPEVSQFQISPNGEYYAYLKPYKTRQNIFVRRVDGTKGEKRLTNQIDRDIAGFFWKEDNTLLFLRDFGGNENFHIFRIGVDGQDESDLTPFENARAGIISSLEGVSDDEILISLNKRDARVFDIYRLNINSKEMTLVAQNPGNYTNWLADHNGVVRIAIASDGVNNTILHRAHAKQDFRPVLTTNFKDSLKPLFFDFDNKHIYATSNLKRDKSALVLFDLEKKREVKIVYQHPTVDILNASFSRKRKVLTSASFIDRKYEVYFLDQEFSAIYQHLKTLMPDYEIYMNSRSRDEDKMIVRTMDDRSRGSFYFYDVKAKTLSHLADLSPWIKSEEMAPMKSISYKSRDGLTIHGYLTLPVGSDGKNLPIIVNPHGGPWSRDVWGFNSEVQFMANRGYGVLQMDFRGSIGYGKKFWSSSFKKWGKEMQNDITDGVQYLIDQGIADPKRVCIYGASYGGYATLAGLAFTPEVYACGISYVGVSNIFTLLETIPPYWEPMREMFHEMVGHPVKDKKLLEEASPLFYVDKMKAPLLVAQGAQDPRVKQAESDQIVEALKERGIDVPYLLKLDEGHGFSNEENRFEFYRWMESFLSIHLGV